MRAWNIDAGTWQTAATLLPQTGYPTANKRALTAGLACDDRGNVILHARIQYADNLYYLWEHKWPSGSAISSATGSGVRIGGSAAVSLAYGTVVTDRDNQFYKFPHLQTAPGTFYIDKGTFEHSSSYDLIYTSAVRLDYIHVYVQPTIKDSISEFHQFMLEYTAAGPVIQVSYNDDLVKKVGTFVMGSIG